MNRLTRRACLQRLTLAVSSSVLAPAMAETTGLAAVEMEAIAGIATETMAQGGIPGLSIAFAHSGNLVHSAGFGFADKAAGEKVTPAHRFRIASVSKPITSTAIWSLIEEGKLKLEDKVFGAGGVLPAYQVSSAQTGVADITIQHLLTHTCGGWGNKGRDPMFMHPEMSHEELIAWTLRELPLQNAPGKVYAYSNFGYCVLGRVLETVTGATYAEFVQQRILSKCGITAMSLAGNGLAERQSGEVVYYGQRDEDPYRPTMNVRRMDSHGGWLATPGDLVRFLTHVDGFATTPDLLGADALKGMTTGSSANPGYACGWSVNGQPNWWHNGSLPGTSTIVVRTASGMCWAAFANSRFKEAEAPGKNTGAMLDRMMWRMARAVPAWRA
ncbi:MAG: serine hydrolase domain-containing protein [Prosthecobacter sp.]|nr:serine hydrolase domain-containing protein [Prosthecobacter sp.]